MKEEKLKWWILLRGFPLATAKTRKGIRNASKRCKGENDLVFNSFLYIGKVYDLGSGHGKMVLEW